VRKTEIVRSVRGADEEERAYEEACGVGSVFDKAQPGIPHQDYRVLIMQTVARLSKNPTTKDFALAKATVDRELAKQGVGIVIPAARPSRRTV
jgi:hypothetical protein